MQIPDAYTNIRLCLFFGKVFFYQNAVSAPSDHDWPEGLPEDGDNLFPKHKLLGPENRLENFIDHWHNAQLMQKNSKLRLFYILGCYAVLNRYCKAFAVCRATKHPNRSAAGYCIYTASPESGMRSISIDVFAMPELTVEGEVFDCVILAFDRHSGYIVAVPSKQSKKKDATDKDGVGLQGKTVAQPMFRHWFTVFNVPAVICSDRGKQFVGPWFPNVCK